MKQPTILLIYAILLSLTVALLFGKIPEDKFVNALLMLFAYLVPSPIVGDNEQRG